nr:uncharacterized protein CFP56_38146 [Quercus suber]
MIKQIWSSSMASRRWSSASRRRHSASTLSWSGSDGGDPVVDAIVVTQPQSQREERVAWGGRHHHHNVASSSPSSSRCSGRASKRNTVPITCEGSAYRNYGLNLPQSLIAFDLGTEKFRVFTIPVQTSSHYWMRLEVLGGHLCFVETDVNFRSNVWTVKEYGEPSSWTHIYEIEKPCTSARYYKPLTFSNDSKKLVLEEALKELWQETATCIGSLLLLEGDNVVVEEESLDVKLRLKIHQRFFEIVEDTDVMWLRNPLVRLSTNETKDLQISTDNFLGDSQSEKHLINTGFYYIRSNNKTIKLLEKWYAMKDNSTGQKEQDVLLNLIGGGIIRELNLSVRFLDTLYFSGFCQDSGDLRAVATVHANCCKSISAKVNDLKAVLRDWKRFKKYASYKRLANVTANLRWSFHLGCYKSWRVANTNMG